MRTGNWLLALGASLALMCTSDIAAAQGGTSAASRGAGISPLPGRGDDPPERSWSLRIGASYDYNRFGQFSSVAGDQSGIRSSSGDDAAVGLGAFLEFMFGDDCPWFWNVGYHQSRLHYRQDYLSGIQTTGDVDGSFLSATTGYAFRPRGFSVRPFFGVARARNYSSIRQTLGTNPLLGSRTLVNYKSDLGVNLDVPLFESRLEARLGFNYLGGFKKPDADASQRYSGGLMFRF